MSAKLIATLPRAALALLAVLACGRLLLSSTNRGAGLRVQPRQLLLTPNDLLFSLQPQHGGSQQAPTSCPTAADIQASPWAESCTLLNKVCVDQGNLVLYDERYQPPPGDGLLLPEFSSSPNTGQFVFTYRNGATKYMYPLSTIRSRPASAPNEEGTAYLKDPVFSKCTVPVVWYPFWMTNFGHFLRDNCAKLFGFVEDTPWRQNIKLVQMTADGLSMPQFNHQLLQTMTPLRVETWADFATRLAPGAEALVQPGPPPSAEGNHQRCFESMFICNQGLNITRWPLHGFGRHVVETYSELMPPEVQAAAATPSSILQQAATGAGSSSSKGSSSGGSQDVEEGGATVLNVVFQKRLGEERQLLNIDELLRGCNSWQHRTAGGRLLRAKCWEAEITDLASGLVASQLADVFVGIHGANLANGWMMRPGASMIEVQLYGFDQHVPHLQDPLFNERDEESHVLWWVLMGCDPGAWEPSPSEAMGVGGKKNYVKNRNMRLRWEALDTALQQVAEVGGDMQRYRQLWAKGEWWWHVFADNITYGGHHRNKCSTESLSD